jgi:hypothetical protein
MHTWIHKIQCGLDLGEATTSSLIVLFVISHGGCIQLSFFQIVNPEIPKIGILATLEAHNFLCKPLIKVRFKVNF